MKAKFNGLDYHVLLEEEHRDIYTSKSFPIHSNLRNWQDTADLGRTVTLLAAENKNPEGAELTLDKKKNVTIKLSHKGYDYLLRQGKISTTYLQTENKLRIEVKYG